MKRVFCLIFVFVLIFALASCGSKKKKENNENNSTGPVLEEEVVRE